MYFKYIVILILSIDFIITAQNFTIKAGTELYPWHRFRIQDKIHPWTALITLPSYNSKIRYQCNPPIEETTQFKNCTPLEARFPSSEVSCACLGTKIKTARLTCHDHSWYPHTAGVCGQSCLASTIPPNVLCENIPNENLYDEELNCSCVSNCMTLKLSCGTMGKWYLSSNICNLKSGEETRDGVRMKFDSSRYTLSCGSIAHETTCVNGSLTEPLQCSALTETDHDYGTIAGIKISATVIIISVLSIFLIICIIIMIIFFVIWFRKAGGECCADNEEPLIEMSNRPMSTVNKYSPSPHSRRINPTREPRKYRAETTGVQGNFRKIHNEQIQHSENNKNDDLFDETEYQNFDKDNEELAEYQNFSSDVPIPNQSLNDETPEYFNLKPGNLATCLRNALRGISYHNTEESDDLEYQNATSLGYNTNDKYDYPTSNKQVFTITQTHNKLDSYGYDIPRKLSNENQQYDYPKASSSYNDNPNNSSTRTQQYDLPESSETPQYDHPKSSVTGRVQYDYPRNVGISQRNAVDSDIYVDMDGNNIYGNVPVTKRY